MKVLQVNCVYNYGSTGKITHDIHKELLAQGFESVVYYGRGQKTNDPGVTKICSEFYGKANNILSRIRGTMYGGCHLSTNKLIRAIQKEKPDVVHLQCINGYFVNIYRLLSWLKQQNIPTVLTLHAEFMYTGNCGHALECEKWKSGCGNCPRWRQETKSWFFDRTAESWRRMRAAFEDFENLTVVSVSPWLMERAKHAPMLTDKIHRVVLNGVNTDIFQRYDTDHLHQKHGITDEKIIFHATAAFSNDPSHIKGGYYILQLAEMLNEENVKVIVAGRYEESLAVPDNVILLGQVQDQGELARYYAMADVTVLTSRKETFSMVTAESLCCGTPVVGFEAGAPEMIAIPEYSAFVPYGDLEALSEAVHRKLDETDIDCTIIERRAKEQYAQNRMVREYIDIYRGCIHEASC